MDYREQYPVYDENKGFWKGFLVGGASILLVAAVAVVTVLVAVLSLNRPLLQ